MAIERVPGGWSVRLRFGADRRLRFRIPDLSSDPKENERLATARARRLEELARSLSKVPHAQALLLLRAAAGARDESHFRSAAKVAIETAATAKAPAAPAAPARPKTLTFRDVCDQLLSGELARRFGERAGTADPTSLSTYRAPLERFCQTLGDMPVASITVDDAERALAALPKMAGSTRARYAGALARVLSLSAFPLRAIERSPLPEGWRPSAGPRRVFPFLYPDEDAKLMRCKHISTVRKLLYGFLAREGMRISEALAMTWSDVDLARGTVRLDKNKTKSPRRWRLGDDVVRALRLRAAELESMSESRPTARVFAEHGFKLAKAAPTFRADLERCEIRRDDLHATTAERRPIRIHDLRGTFVTLALATGRSEAWVMDRTGHTTSAMLNRYRSQARHAAEIELGRLGPLDFLVYPGQARDASFETTEETRVSKKSLTDSETLETVEPEPVSAATPEPLQGETVAVPGGAGQDPVELALAAALEAATKAGRFDVVLEVTRELRERRLARGRGQ